MFNQLISTWWQLFTSFPVVKQKKDGNKEEKERDYYRYHV